MFVRWYCTILKYIISISSIENLCLHQMLRCISTVILSSLALLFFFLQISDCSREQVKKSDRVHVNFPLWTLYFRRCENMLLFQGSNESHIKPSLLTFPFLLSTSICHLPHTPFPCSYLCQSNSSVNNCQTDSADTYFISPTVFSFPL